MSTRGGGPTKFIPGVLHPENKGGADWGHQNLFAYACQSHVVVVDPETTDVIQSLHGHKLPVTHVKWSKEALSYNIHKTYRLKLASADKTGTIILWDVGSGQQIHSMQEEKAVTDMAWHLTLPTLCATLHASSALVLWDMEIGVKLWSLPLPEVFTTFSFNPYDVQNVLFASTTGWVYEIEDFSGEKEAPSSLTRKYKVSGAQSSDGKVSQLQQIVHAPHTRNIAYFVLTNEVIIFDLHMEQGMGMIVADRKRSNKTFESILLCRDNPRLAMCAHTDGSISVRQRLEDYTYESVCSSEVVRVAGQSVRASVHDQAPVLYAVLNGPNRQSSVCAVSDDGRFWRWQLQEVSPVSPSPVLQLTGLAERIGAKVRAIDVCCFPSPNGTSQLAVGSSTGDIQIFDIQAGTLISAHSVHSSAVRGTRWIDEHSLLSFSFEHDEKKKEYKNHLIRLDVRSGTLTRVRHMNQAETAFIRGIRVSALGQYVVVLLKDRPFEVRCLDDGTVMRSVHEHAQLTSIEWKPLSDPVRDLEAHRAKQAKVEYEGGAAARVVERFVFTVPDGKFFMCSVENGAVRPGGKMPSAVGQNMVSSLAWKGNYIACGDTLGNLHVWDGRSPQMRAIQTNRGLIRRVKFSHKADHFRIAVLFNEGDFGVWEIVDGKGGACAARGVVSKGFTATDVAWAGENPVIASLDGSVRILDRNFGSKGSRKSNSNNPISLEYLSTPLLLHHKHALCLKTLLQHGMDCKDLHASRLCPGGGSEGGGELATQLASVDPKLISDLAEEKGIAARCLRVADYFGDNDEARFWTLVVHHLQVHGEAQGSSTPAHRISVKTTGNLQAVGDTFGGETKVMEAEKESTAAPLPAYFDLLLSAQRVSGHEGNLADLREFKRVESDYALTKKAVESCLLIGKYDKVVHMLLETPPSSERFLADCMKACLVSAVLGPDTFRSTIKMVATSLISADYLGEGVQLLRLVDDTREACRYLQSHGKWNNAARLAKVALDNHECDSVFRDWAQHLCENGEQANAVEIQLSLGAFHHALHLLHEMQAYEQAALLAVACLESGVLSRESAADDDAPKDLLPLQYLIDTLFLEYGTHLHEIGHYSLAEHFLKQAGPAGVNTIEIMSSEKDNLGA